MQTKFDLINTTLNPALDKLNREAKLPTKADPAKVKGPAFDDMLEKKIDGAPKDSGPELKFSAHAKSRLTSRGIELSSDEILKMQDAVQKAGKRGSKESLILTDKAAFIVSVKNNTVITAVDKNSLKDNVFSNIDSTIMI